MLSLKCSFMDFALLSTYFMYLFFPDANSMVWKNSLTCAVRSFSTMIIRSTATVNHLNKPGPSPLISKHPFSIAPSLRPIISPEPNINPPVQDLSTKLYSLLSNPNWQKHPSLKKLIPILTPNHLANFYSQFPNLNPQTALNFFNYLSCIPSFKPSVQSYSSLLHILIPNKFLGFAEKLRISMIKTCESPEDAQFVLGVLRDMNNSKTHHDSGLLFKIV